jgi:PadR family transcriptional regulator, regulatory protein PadR
MGKGGDIFGNSPNRAWSFDEVRWPRNRFAGPFTAFRATEMRDPVDAELGTSIIRSQSRQSTSIGSRVSTSMNDKDQYKNRIELLQGTLDMLILQTLQWGPQHGYGIVQSLRLRSGDVLQVETGSLYPALHRLERQSWVQSEWKQSESKQKARYYRITAKGKKQLASDLGRWERIVEAIGSVMYVKPEESES